MGYKEFLTGYLEEYARLNADVLERVMKLAQGVFTEQAARDFLHAVEQPPSLGEFTIKEDTALAASQEDFWERVEMSTVSGQPRITDVSYKCYCNSFERGQCAICLGEGTGPDGQACEACQGSGVCLTCKGSGLLTFSGSDFPADPFQSPPEAPVMPGMSGEEDAPEVHKVLKEFLIGLDLELRHHAQRLFEFYRKHHDTSVHGYPFMEFFPSMIEEVEEIPDGGWFAYVSVLDEEYRLAVRDVNGSLTVTEVQFPCECQEDPFYDTGICECVEEGGGQPDPDCEACFGTGVILCPICYGEGWIPYDTLMNPPEEPNLALYINAAARFMEDLES